MTSLNEIQLLIRSLTPPEGDDILRWPFHSYDHDELKYKCMICDKFVQTNDGHVGGGYTVAMTTV